MSGIGLEEDNIRYCAMVYYLRREEYWREIHFVITKNLESDIKAVHQEYTARGATIGPNLSVEFESDNISPNIPPHGITLENGWRIFPLFTPAISKAEVNNFRPGMRIPSFQLGAEWTEQSKPSRLIHQIPLEGVNKRQYNYFSIVLDSDPILPSRTSGDHHSKYPAGLDSGPELPDLMNEVAAEIPSKWRVVGLRLGLDQGILDGIASISSGDTNLCYINVFSRWKNQNSTTYPYTWSTIVWALQAPAVGESRLAEKIKNKLTGQ